MSFFYLYPSARPVALIIPVLLLLGFSPFQAGAQPVVPRFKPGDCHFEVRPEHGPITCGDLIVYENRDDPSEGTLRLAVAILESTSDAPAPDPLVFLMGGPGGATLDRMPWRATHPFWNQYRATRDVIFYDQRGTGFSEPTFCPSLNRALFTDGLRGFSTEELRQRQLAEVRACREEMLAQGVDFSQYNSIASAHDLDDLRTSLGVASWNVLGISYGTRLGLEALRETPDGIRSIILDSVAPVNAGYWNDELSRFAGALRRVFDQCATDAACREAFPTLEADTYDLFARLEEEPIVVAMDDTSRFPDRRIVADGTVIASGIFQGLYSHHFVPYLPLVVRELRAGNTDLLAAMGDAMVPPPDAISRGMYYSVECYEVAPTVSPSRIAAERATYPELAPMRDWLIHPAVCEAWHPHRADTAALRPVGSDVPALLLAGEFDPITPPSYARLAAETLSNHTLVEVQSRGHSVVHTTACTRGLMERFLDDPTAPLDTSCVAEVSPVQFVTDVHLNSGVFQTLQRFASGPSTRQMAGLGGLGVVLLSGLLVWPVGYIVRCVRRCPVTTTRPQRIARWTAALAVLVVVGFVAGLGLVVAEAASAYPFLLSLGVPSGAGWLFVLPWLGGLLALGALGAAVQAWRHGWWSAAHRVHFTLVAAAAATTVALVAQWGLL
jgi:pimeloyl-ACP methyl ester carboxylesterase